MHLPSARSCTFDSCKTGDLNALSQIPQSEAAHSPASLADVSRGKAVYFIYFALLPREVVAFSHLDFEFLFFLLHCSRTETSWDLVSC